MLSVFITPWTNPTSIHCATSDAWTATTASNSARYGLSACGRAGIVPGDRVVGEAPQQVDVAGGRGVLEAADPQVAARPPGPARRPAARVSRCTGRPVATTARDRVVGMPSACIASLTMYSRSIGPTAARPSPPRANGVAPEPLRWMSRSRPSRADELAEQQRAPVAQPRDEPAELVPGVGLRDRRGAVGHRDCRPGTAARRGSAARQRRGPGRRPTAR